jgi:hypothetical protein
MPSGAGASAQMISRGRASGLVILVVPSLLGTPLRTPSPEGALWWQA